MANTMAAEKTGPLTEIVNARSITTDDLRRLEREVFPRGITSADEADVLIHLHDVCEILAPEWNDYYTSALSEYFIDAEEPKGSISSAEGAALIAKFAAAGRIENDLDFELLLKSVESAHQCADNLVLFLLEQTRHGAVHGHGPVRQSPPSSPPSLEKAEVDIIKRILFPLSTRKQRTLSQCQAAYLMDFNDILDEKANHASWTDVYVKSLLGFAVDWSSTKAREMEQREKWKLKPYLLKRFSGVGRSKSEPADRKPDQVTARENVILFPNGQKDDGVSADPVAWFAARIKTLESVDRNNKQLLQKLKRQSEKLHSHIVSAVREMCNTHGIP